MHKNGSTLNRVDEITSTILLNNRRQVISPVINKRPNQYPKGSFQIVQLINRSMNKTRVQIMNRFKT